MCVVAIATDCLATIEYLIHVSAELEFPASCNDKRAADVLKIDIVSVSHFAVQMIFYGRNYYRHVYMCLFMISKRIILCGIKIKETSQSSRLNICN